MENDPAFPDGGPRQQDISATFAKGLSVLKAFDAAHGSLGFSDVARICGIDRAIARRLVLTLVYLGYVRRNGKSYELTPKVLVLAGGYLQGRQFGKLIQPVLERYARNLGATVSLAVLEDDHAIYLAQASADATRISFGFTVGSRLPLSHSAIGRAVLAASAPATAQQILARLPAGSPDIVSRVETARRDGLAMAEGEMEPLVTGIAVPLAPRQGHGAGYAVGTSILTANAAPEMIAALATGLRDCARDLSAIL